MASKSIAFTRTSLIVAAVSALALLVLGFASGFVVSRIGTSDVRRSCMVTMASANQRSGAVAGDFLDGDSGCISDEPHICWSFAEPELWNCATGRP